MANKCAGCLKKIPNKEFLTCSHCNKIYDLDCANVSLQRFLNTLDKDHRKIWKCQYCICNMPKNGNLNTPVRLQQLTSLNVNENNLMGNDAVNNITIRQKTHISKERDSLTISDDDSILGDTIQGEMRNNQPNSEPQIQLSVVQLEKILDKKFENIKQDLLMELKTTILSEITNSIQQLKFENIEITNGLIAEQKDMKEEINKINIYIRTLETDNIKLKTQLHELKNMITESENKNMIPKNQDRDHAKKIILYGLDENSWENDYELHDRVLSIFHDILQVNLIGCIDDMKRLGRHGQRRPLMIELLSKQTKRYILQNKNLFNGTGLTVHECLDRASLELRKTQIQVLIKARNEGQYAIIRDNKLIINGEICHDHYGVKGTTTKELLDESQGKDMNPSLRSLTTNEESGFSGTKNTNTKPEPIQVRQGRTNKRTFRGRF